MELRWAEFWRTNSAWVFRTLHGIRTATGWRCWLCACGVLTGALGKMARDISLLMQNEVGEVAEPSGPGRGGSSTMPHKRNPSGCVVALAAAGRAPALVAGFLSAMVQEHERAAGSWQAEWPTVGSLMQATGAAAASMAEVAEGLSVDATRMRANIDDTRGLIFAERVMMLLGEKLGRDVAHKLLEEATRQCFAQKLHLSVILAQMPEVARHLDPATLSTIERPEEYLGCADAFRKRHGDRALRRLLHHLEHVAEVTCGDRSPSGRARRFRSCGRSVPPGARCSAACWSRPWALGAVASAVRARARPRGREGAQGPDGRGRLQPAEHLAAGRAEHHLDLPAGGHAGHRRRGAGAGPPGHQGAPRRPRQAYTPPSAAISKLRIACRHGGAPHQAE